MFIFTDPIESESRPRDCFFHPEESGFNPDPIKISNFVSMPVEILSSRYLEGSFIHVWMESLQLFFFAPHRILGNNRSLQKPPPPPDSTVNKNRPSEYHFNEQYDILVRFKTRSKKRNFSKWPLTRFRKPDWGRIL